MTKGAALFRFFSSFGLLAYEENSVPTGEDSPKYPYLTYQAVFDDLNYEIPISCSLWYRTTSWVEPNAKTAEISKGIGRGGKLVFCDDGAIWIKRGSPFAQNMSEDSDDQIKRIYINLSVEFMTAD